MYQGFCGRARCVVTQDGRTIGYGVIKHSTPDGEICVRIDGELADHNWPSDSVDWTAEEEGN